MNEPEDIGNTILRKTGNICPSSMHNLPEDFNFQQHSCENFKYNKTRKINVMTLMC